MVADADRLDAVYRVLARHLPMSAAQRRNVLARRGIPLPIRQRMGELVGRLPSDPNAWPPVHASLVRDLKAVAPADFLARVPELAVREGGSYAVLHTRRKAQYFEPWKDEHGRIVALRAYMGARAPQKYLTTSGRWGSLVHFAFGCARDRVGEAPWIFTEGWVKAEVAAHHFGCVGVAFAGVGQKSAWPRALEAKQRLAPDAPAFIAFDAETWTTRLDLTLFSLELARAIQDATGHPAGYAVWDAAERRDGSVEPKGIDDAIAAGSEVRLVDRHGFAPYLAPVLDRWEVAHAA